MGLLIQNGDTIGGISSELVNKIGSATLTTTASDLSGAVNELNTNKATKATTLSGYGITDAKIENGTITLGSNNIIPLTSASTLNAAKLSGTIPSECYTDTNNAVTQTATDSTNSTYELLFSGTADNTTRTEGVRKSSNLIYNPYHKHIFMYDANNEEMVRIGIDEGVNYNSGAVVVRDTDYDYVSLDLNGISSSYDLGLSSHEGVHVWYSYGNAHGFLYCGDIMKGDNNDTWDGTNTSLEDALSDKAAKATTLAGYGITDAKITNGTITLGSNSITPLTSHQDISGKVNKSGDTMTGALNFANNTWNNVGDDVAIGDHNTSGSLGIKGLNSNPKITFIPPSGTNSVLASDGKGNLQFNSGGFYSHQCASSGGTTGYFNFLQIEVTGAYVNRAIILSLVGRNNTQTTCTIMFQNNSGSDPDINVLYYGARPIYFIKTTTSKWNFYIQKEEGYGNTIINIINPGQLTNGGIIWTWKDSTVTSLPSSYRTATLQTLNLTSQYAIAPSNASNFRSSLGLGSMATQNTGSFAKYSAQEWGTSMSFTPSNGIILFTVNSALFLAFMNGSYSGTYNLHARCINKSLYKNSAGTGSSLSVTYTSTEAEIGVNTTIKLEKTGKFTITTNSSAQMIALYN